MSRPTLYLVDGSAQIHRAYFAIRGLSTGRGLPTNATYGFTTMLRKLLEDEKPEWIGISFDVKARTFRHEQFADYKANRPRMQDDLNVQLPFVRRVCDAFRLPVLELPGFEADDVIATLAKQAVERDMDVVVVSLDKDLLQLVSDRVKVLNPGREGSGSTLYDHAAVEKKLGVPPQLVVDWLALVGDSVDNVPGVPGIGEKGARDLIAEFGSLEAVLENAGSVKRKAYREGLEQHREQALLSKRLVTLREDAPIELDLEALRRHEPDAAAAHALFVELEFQALAREYAPEASAADLELRVAVEEHDVDAAIAAAREAGSFGLRVLTTPGPALGARVVGAALSWKPGTATYLPLGHQGVGAPDAAAQRRAFERLAPLLRDATVEKLSATARAERLALAELGCELRGLGFDATVGAYLLNPGRRSYSLPELALDFLGERRPDPGESTAEATAPVDAAGRAAGADAELVLRLAGPVLERVEEEGLGTVLRETELPLVEILADMERVGVKLDVALLEGMSRDMEGRLGELTQQIHELAGGEFNIN